MSVVAVIPAKGTSRRVPGKNLAPFGCGSLLTHKIAQLKAVPLIDKVVVGTDCPEVAAQAIGAGAQIRLQDPYHSSDACPIRDRWRDLAGMFEAETVVWAHCTNPLTRSADYQDAIECYLSTGLVGYDSLMSVSPVQRHAWKRGPRQGRGTPLNFDPRAIPYPYAADLDPIYFQNGAIFIQPHRALLKNGFFYGDNPYLFTLKPPHDLDIDVQADLDLARDIWQAHHEPQEVPA